MTEPAPAAAAEPVIRVSGLGKTFRRPGRFRDLLRGRPFVTPVHALTDVNLTVASGEVVCVVGPNGAGKSTLLRILAGLITPTVGSARVLGHDVGAIDVDYRRRVALVVGDERSFHFRLSGRENLYFYAALHGLPVASGRRRCQELIEIVGLGDAADQLFREYSRGMRQRLVIARGLLGDPQVLLLDEPTLGLDPRGARDLRRFIRREMIEGAGRTALVGSNDPSEVRAIADRVVLLEKGRLVGETRPESLEAALGLDAGGGSDGR